MIATTHYKALLKLGIPIVIGQLGMIVLGFADTLMIGHHSTEDLAAASFVNNMFNLVIIFATGFSYGLTPIVGRLFGSGDKKSVGCTLKNALWANGLMGILLSALMGILYLNIHRLGQPEELLPLMRPYYMVLLVSLIFVMLFNGSNETEFLSKLVETFLVSGLCEATVHVGPFIILAIGSVCKIVSSIADTVVKLFEPHFSMFFFIVSSL